MSFEAEAGGLPRTPAPRDIGLPFGRFRLLDRIGTGDVSEVYRATVVGVQGFERRVAIKVLRPDIAETDVGRLYAEEARVTALLEHPSVVQVYEFGVIEGAPFIAMEYLRGRNLEQVMTALRAQTERLPPSLAVFIAQKVASALALAHELEDAHGHSLELIHGDVTPANIMLVREGAVKLLDFGVAQVVRDKGPAVTREGRPLPRHVAYLSPEQAIGHPADCRSDVFALGIVLWEMLTGRRLFAGNSDRQTLAHVTRGDIPPPSHFAPDVSPELDRVVLTAMSRDLERRYPNAILMALELEEVMRTLPSRHGELLALLERLGDTRETGMVDTSTLAAIPAAQPSHRPSAWSRMLRDPRALLVGVAGLAAGIAVAATLTGRPGNLVGSAPVVPSGETAPGASPPTPPIPGPSVIPLPCGPTDAAPCPGDPPAPTVAADPEPTSSSSRARRSSRRSSSSEARRAGPRDRRPNPFR